MSSAVLARQPPAPENGVEAPGAIAKGEMMIRKFKVLGLALMAVFAITAVSASGAQAFTLFNSENAETSVKGTQTSTHKFKAAGGTIECTEAKFKGMVTGKEVKTVTVSAEYPKGTCTFLGFINIEVKMNGCEYEFNASGTVSIVGASCTNITFEGGGCKVKVPGGAKNAGLSSVSYTNKEAGKERQILVEPAVKGITYTSSGLCPKNGENLTNGEYFEGKTTVTGETATGSASMVGIFAS